MAFGIDFSWARPSTKSLQAAGVQFVGRYLNQPGGKGLSATEYESYRTAGIPVFMIYEETGRELLGGAAAGKRCAQTAVKLLDTLGLAVRPVYFAVDFAAGPDQLKPIAAALDAAAGVLGAANVGVYGSADVIDALVPAHAHFGYQTYAWSGGRVSSHANVYQYRNGQKIGGGSVDFDHNLTADFGATTTRPASTVADTGYNMTAHPTSIIQRLVGVTADGIYGPATTAAVKAWQRTHGLTADGIVGPKTAAAMFPTKTAPAKPTKAALAVDGIWGVQTTKALQGALHVTTDGVLGPVTIKALQTHLHVKADGILGPATRKALQHRIGVTQDGIWGPQTTRALQRALNAGKF